MKKMKPIRILIISVLYAAPMVHAEPAQPAPWDEEPGKACQHATVKGNDTICGSADPRTYCRYVPERLDDFAWENDKVAFRTYGPALKEKTEDSGIDCWLKRVDYPIIDRWYKSGDYHEDHGEGLDSYKVGDSRGCGGTALWIDRKLVISNVYTTWEIIKSETDESVFVLRYEYRVGDDVYSEEKEITIKMGDRLFKSVSTFRKNGEIAANLSVAIGLVLDQGHEVFSDPEKGWMSTWGNNQDTELGTGVVIDPARMDEFLVQDSGKPLSDHALIISKTDSEGRVEHYAGYGWSAAKEITSAEAWNDYLATFSSCRQDKVTNQDVTL